MIQKRARIILADSNRDDHLKGLTSQSIFMWERQFTYLPKNKLDEKLLPCDLRLSETTIAFSSPRKQPNGMDTVTTLASPSTT